MATRSFDNVSIDTLLTLCSNTSMRKEMLFRLSEHRVPNEWLSVKRFAREAPSAFGYAKAYLLWIDIDHRGMKVDEETKKATIGEREDLTKYIIANDKADIRDLLRACNSCGSQNLLKFLLSNYRKEIDLLCKNDSKINQRVEDLLESLKDD
jgi:hypothetical protein